MQIGVSKEEFEVHLESIKHQRNINLRALSSLSSSAETVFSVPSATFDTSQPNFECNEEPNGYVNHNGLSNSSNASVESTLSTLSRNNHNSNNTISVTISNKRDVPTNRISIDDLLAMTNGTDHIPEESVAFIETNIPFGDPVISGIELFIWPDYVPFIIATYDIHYIHAHIANGLSNVHCSYL